MGTPPTQYEISVCGQLGETLLAAFPGMSSEVAPGQTLLSGTLADQSALYGVLSQLEALGLELIAVRRCGSAAADGVSSPA
jgi:monoterpene epsilon-lactone hydrolase